MNELIIGSLLTTTGIMVGALLNHFFAGKRKIDELLFNNRKIVYSQYIQYMGTSFFNKDKIKHMERQLDFLESHVNNDLTEFIKEKASVTSNIKSIREEIISFKGSLGMGEIFSNARLVAGPRLEMRLRELYDILKDNPDNVERFTVSFEIEALMRRDLRVIGRFELASWIISKRIPYNWVKKKKKETPVEEKMEREKE